MIELFIMLQTIDAFLELEFIFDLGHQLAEPCLGVVGGNNCNLNVCRPGVSRHSQ